MLRISFVLPFAVLAGRNTSNIIIFMWCFEYEGKSEFKLKKKQESIGESYVPSRSDGRFFLSGGDLFTFL